MKKSNKSLQDISQLRNLRTALLAFNKLDKKENIISQLQNVIDNKGLDKLIEETDKEIEDLNKKDLLTAFVRVNLTPMEKEELVENRKNMGYKTNAAYIRDILLDQVTIKRICTPETIRFFNDTNALYRVFDIIKDDIEDSGLSDESTNHLINAINHLIKNQENIRQQVVNIHNRESVFLLAKELLKKDDLINLLQRAE